LLTDKILTGNEFDAVLLSLKLELNEIEDLNVALHGFTKVQSMFGATQSLAKNTTPFI
jgi:hypothetical protein